jgi:hypothetical protein
MFQTDRKSHVLTSISESCPFIDSSFLTEIYTLITRLLFFYTSFRNILILREILRRKFVHQFEFKKFI